MPLVPAGPSSASALSNNPQAIVPEGLNLRTLTALPSTALPAIPPSVPAAIPRPSTKNHRSLALLRGPVPQKGSKQDRFRQFLKNETSPFAVATDTTQQPQTAQRYCTWAVPSYLVISSPVIQGHLLNIFTIAQRRVLPRLPRLSSHSVPPPLPASAARKWTALSPRYPTSRQGHSRLSRQRSKTLP